jgi:hypothetical protein
VPPRPPRQRSDWSTVPWSRRTGTTTDVDFPYLRLPRWSPSRPHPERTHPRSTATVRFRTDRPPDGGLRPGLGSLGWVRTVSQLRPVLYR